MGENPDSMMGVNEPTPIQSTTEDRRAAFEEKMLRRVRADFIAADRFLTDWHRDCSEAYTWYHNASTYGDLKKDSRFPMPFLQKQTDTFVAFMMDRLYYKDRPCTVIGREDTDKEDATAKQAMLDYQDYMDKVQSKWQVAVQDASLYRAGIMQIGFVQKYKNQLVGVQKPMTSRNQEGIEVPLLLPNGQPQTVSVTQVQSVPVYIGPEAVRIDPLNFFFTQEKKSMEDDYPVMVRSFHRKAYFEERRRRVEPDEDGKPAVRGYFINLDKFEEVGIVDKGTGGGDADLQNEHLKRMARGYRPDAAANKNEVTYVEWWGKVKKWLLYEYLGERMADDAGRSLMDDKEEAWCVCGVANDKLVVRLEESPFKFDGPNIIVATIQRDEDELIGISIADKIAAVQQGKDSVMGMHLENLKQTVNAGHVFSQGALATPGPLLVNRPGWVIQVTGDVRAAHKRIDMQPVSPDLMILQQFLSQEGQDASGIQEIIEGKGDPQAETLGENEMVLGQASIRMNGYLKCLEDTGIEPFYAMRNQINMQFLNQPYVYAVIGEPAFAWKTIQPIQIRANVDFICESSSRESNRMVISQQILQLAKVVPMMESMGFPARIDKLVAKLCEKGFSWSRQEVEEWLPSLTLERQGVDINQLLLQTMLMQLQIKQMMFAGAGNNGGNPGGGPMSQPRSEREANASANAQNRTQVGRE